MRVIRPNLFHWVQAGVGLGAARRLAHAAIIVPRVLAAAEPMAALADGDLRRESLALRYRLKSGEPRERVLPEAYALFREAAKRRLDKTLYDVQLVSGITLDRGGIAEMETGEGKTLTAGLPLYLAGLSGRGALLATVNDYLAKRDAEILRPAFELLGMTVGVVESDVPPDNRHSAYACDITYGTAKEFGFDFLRDQLLLRTIRQGQGDIIGRMLGQKAKSGDKPVQREAHFVLVDEADSILIDEARTPLIISAIPQGAEDQRASCFQWASQNVSEFEEGVHFTYDPLKQQAELTAEGRRLARALKKPRAMDPLSMAQIYEFVERAVRAERAFLADKHYVVRDGEVVIVDESTGRLAEGRKWRDGLHQAIEAKAGVKVTPDTGQAARVTVQDFFLRFERMAGMTGTAASAASELRKIYKLQVAAVPTNRPVIRQRLPSRVFGTSAGRWNAVVAEIAANHAQGRPVLIGTRSIARSQQLAERLAMEGIPHQVLNAYHLAAEADIVSMAGQRGRVTVSTNMAGRGTDIKLGPGVKELGGLHVIAIELNDSARIDRQLYGRCARQGDPGTYRVFMALDDEILFTGLGRRAAERWKAYGLAHPEELSGSLARHFARAQRRLERKHFRDRKILLYYERQRQKMQRAMGQDPHLDTPT